jgi:hypothetical protein
MSIVVAFALLFAFSSTAFAAVQGDPLLLGITNRINILTTVTGSVASATFRVINSSTAPDASGIRVHNTGGGPALDLRVLNGKAPMVVSSNGKVNNLNVDMVDGFDSTSFMGATTFRVESPLGLGQDLGDGTFKAFMSCPPGSLLLSGGPANISPTSIMVESFPASTTIWHARINPNGLTDNWNVVALCATR